MTVAIWNWSRTPNASLRSWRRSSEREEPTMTQVSSEHLGESLGTDFFSVREQFTDEQWSHFVTVRRFVDEEVVPVTGPYWERAEICWPLVKRLPELGIVGEDITGYGCAGMSPMACVWSRWNCTAAMAAWAWSSACTRAWPCSRSRCAVRRSRRRAGCPAWPRWTSSARSR